MSDEAIVQSAPAAPSEPSEPNDQSNQAETPQGDQPPVTKEEARKYKLKAQGVEREYTEEEILKHASMGLSAQEKWQEAAQLRKANEAFLRQLQSDPLSVLQNPALGLDIENIARGILARQINEDLLTPEQKRQRDMEEELEGYRSKSKAEQERTQQEQQAKADQEWASNTKASVVDGLKTNGLPYTQFTWNSTLQYMAAAIDAGYEDVTADQVMHLVKRDYQQAFEDFYQAPPEELLQRIGEQNIAKIQQAVIAKAKGGGFQPPKKEEAPAPKVAQSYDEFLREQKAKMRRGEI